MSKEVFTPAYATRADPERILLCKILTAILAGAGSTGAVYQGNGSPNGQITPTVSGNQGAVFYQLDSTPPNQVWTWNVSLQTWQ